MRLISLSFSVCVYVCAFLCLSSKNSIILSSHCLTMPSSYGFFFFNERTKKCVNGTGEVCVWRRWRHAAEVTTITAVSCKLVCVCVCMHVYGFVAVQFDRIYCVSVFLESDLYSNVSQFTRVASNKRNIVISPNEISTLESCLKAHTHTQCESCHTFFSLFFFCYVWKNMYSAFASCAIDWFDTLFSLSTLSSLCHFTFGTVVLFFSLACWCWYALLSNFFECEAMLDQIITKIQFQFI